MSAPIRYLVDTNILLRFLTGEPAPQAAAARRLFVAAAAGSIVLEIPSMIAAEAYYTLTGYYGLHRPVASEKLSLLLQQPGVEVRDNDIVMAALERLKVANIGFADAILAASASAESVPVVSFDRDFDKIGIARYEPK